MRHPVTVQSTSALEVTGALKRSKSTCRQVLVRRWWGSMGIVGLKLPNQIRKSSPAYLLASKKDEAHRFSTLLSNKRKHELNTGPPVPTCPALWLAARQ